MYRSKDNHKTLQRSASDSKNSSNSANNMNNAEYDNSEMNLPNNATIGRSRSVRLPRKFGTVKAPPNPSTSPTHSLFADAAATEPPAPPPSYSKRDSSSPKREMPKLHGSTSDRSSLHARTSSENSLHDDDTSSDEHRPRTPSPPNESVSLTLKRNSRQRMGIPTEWKAPDDGTIKRGGKPRSALPAEWNSKTQREGRLENSVGSMDGSWETVRIKPGSGSSSFLEELKKIEADPEPERKQEADDEDLTPSLEKSQEESMSTVLVSASDLEASTPVLRAEKPNEVEDGEEELVSMVEQKPGVVEVEIETERKEPASVPELVSTEEFPALAEANPTMKTEGPDLLEEMLVETVEATPAPPAPDASNSYVAVAAVNLDTAPPAAQAKPVENVPVYRAIEPEPQVMAEPQLKQDEFPTLEQANPIKPTEGQDILEDMLIGQDDAAPVVGNNAPISFVSATAANLDTAPPAPQPEPVATMPTYKVAEPKVLWKQNDFPTLEQANPIQTPEGQDILEEMLVGQEDAVPLPANPTPISYVSATAANLDVAPPSAEAEPVDTVPVFTLSEVVEPQPNEVESEEVEPEPKEVESAKAEPAPLHEKSAAVESQQPKEEFPVLEDANPIQQTEGQDVLEGMLVGQTDATTNTTPISYVSATAANLDVAPPSAQPKPVDTVPVYDEAQVLLFTEQQFKKSEMVNEDDEAVPEVQELVVEQAVTATEEIDTKMTMTDLQRHVNFFDRNQDGKITMKETFISLRALGYSIFLSLPATLIFHLRFSPLTSPYPFPFRYRTLRDLFTLPIYTARIHQALTYTSLFSHTPKSRGYRSGAYHPVTGEFRPERFDTLMRSFAVTAKIARVGVRAQQDGVRKMKNVKEVKSGEKVESVETTMVEGVGFWKGLRMMKGMEKEDKGRWYDMPGWFTSKFHWFLTYSLLRDRQTGLVLHENLRGAYDGSAFYQIEEKRYRARQQTNNRERKEKKEKA